MITINHLEVRFDVEGDDDEQLFIQYFNKYIDQWSRGQSSQKRVNDAIQRDRQLGDRPHRGGS